MFKELKQLIGKYPSSLIFNREKDMNRHFSKEGKQLDNIYMEKCSKLIIWEMQIKSS
jgi:hypothetical protein